MGVCEVSLREDGLAVVDGNGTLPLFVPVGAEARGPSTKMMTE